MRPAAGGSAGPDPELDLLGPTPARKGRTGLGGTPGLLPRQSIHGLVDRKVLQATDRFDDAQFQPASLDLRLGETAYRVRASFLPGSDNVLEKLKSLAPQTIDLSKGAILEKNGVYVVELMEHLRLPRNIVALANPKSSTGRVDVFTRLITNAGTTFDTVEPGYKGRLFLEVSPRSFGVRVRQGTRLSQLRFRRFNSNQGGFFDFKIADRDILREHKDKPLVDGGAISVRNGLVLSVDLGGPPDRVIGYKAQKHTNIIDFDAVGSAPVDEYWDPIRARRDGRLILDPDNFYILMSKERLRIPPHLAAEMIPIDPAMGEFRVHYAGFFDPGFGYSTAGHPGARAVMEVRSREVPFNLEDGQSVCRLAYERMSEIPDVLYGAIGTSHYQGQELKLSKQFTLP